ncbi:FAD-binding oxidoreductase [Providencia sp. PROV160]|nr:FAD-binding oxidoreductase [Providencia sp. PROV160]
MTTASISSVSNLNSYICRVGMFFDTELNYISGQFIHVTLECGRSGYFSIASPERVGQTIELHIADTGKPDSFLSKLQVGDKVSVAGPMGNAWLRLDTYRPIIILAFGSGYSYARSILLTEASNDTNRKVSFYWITQTEKDFYERDMLESLPERFSVNLLHFPKGEGTNKSVINALKNKIKEHPAIANYDVYLVGKRRECLLIRQVICSRFGANVTRVYSDSF